MPDMIPSSEKNRSGTEDLRDPARFVGGSGEGPSWSVPNGIQVPSIALPSGGGAMKGIDEKFTVNASNGTASFNIPLPFSKGRNGTNPSFSLAYNSGAGNGIFGLGWGVGIPCIQRKTVKELPAYLDSIESDTFIFSGYEDLIPELVQDSGGNWIKRTAVAGSASISFYRPRIEDAFARIEKWNDSGNVYWIIRTRDNQVSVFGQSDAAKLYSPVASEGKDKTFRWSLQYSYDDKGNFIQYTYKQEDLAGVIPSPGEKNRLNGTAPVTNLYLKSIQYCNAVPWAVGDPFPTNFLLEMVFDYGEHDPVKPATAEVTPWAVRSDPFSDYKPGFELRTYRLCQRILMFHHFPAELGWADYLVKSMDLSYDQHPQLTYLDSVSQTGYIWNTDGSLASKKSVPPVVFSYFKPGFSNEVKTVSPESMVNAPDGLDKNYLWIDLYSEGISGILTEQATGLYYKENQGNGSFGPGQIVNPRPSLSGLGEGYIAIQDLEADGRKCVVSSIAGLKGYYPVADLDSPEPASFRPFEKYPNINLHDPNLKFIDLNGDGMPDMLISLAQEYVWYESLGRLGYDDYHLVARAADDEEGPQILFADKDDKMLIMLSDMTGDGLMDIVLLTWSSVCYYPNLGYGRFGAKVTMGMDTPFAEFTAFNPKSLHLADIDGSGTSDIIYIGDQTIRIWFNESGNSLSSPSSFFNPFPELDNVSAISFIDLLGTGVPCLVWSTSLPSQAYAPLRYIDLMSSRKPHIIYGYTNNQGLELTLEYKSSTQFYLADKQAGRPWITKLPFPVQCVSKAITCDKVSGTRFVNEYVYHHGYYDAREREFRGFAMVEQTDCERYELYAAAASGNAQHVVEQDLYQPTVTSLTWFHTGAWLQREQLFHQLQKEYFPYAQIAAGQLADSDLFPGLSDFFLDQQSVLPVDLEPEAISESFRALKGLPLRQEIYSNEGDPSTGIQNIPYSVTQHDYNVQLLQPRQGQKYAGFYTHERETLTFNFERNAADPRIAHAINIAIDPFGNILESAAIVYGRQNPDASLPTDADRQKQAQQFIIYNQSQFTSLIDTSDTYRTPVLCEEQSWELNVAPSNGIFYTADQVAALFSSASIVPFEQATIAGQKRKFNHTRTLFLKNDLSGPMPFGSLDSLGLPYEHYSMVYTPTLAPSIFGGKFSDALWRNQALYINLAGDPNYWLRSGKTYFYPDLSGSPDLSVIPAPTPGDLIFAKGNFYLAVAYEDNLGNLTKTFYDGYKLLMNRTVDAAGNETNVDGLHYRTLSPYLIRDANDNQKGVRFDELGMVIRTFVMGKAGQQLGDPMDTSSTELSVNDQPSSSLEYDFRYFTSGGTLPDRVVSSQRLQHYYTEPLPAATSGGINGWLQKLFGNGNLAVVPSNLASWLMSYSYHDGSGHEVLKKIQAEPGIAPQRDSNGNLVFDASGNLMQYDTSADNQVRWIGNGRIILNNKGKPVKQYEPFFDSTPEYNSEIELAELGVTDIMYYDAPGRLIKTLHPNGSFSRVDFDAWMQMHYDENDTVLDSSWYQLRINGAMGEAEQEAAQKAAIHYNTPSVAYMDSLARTFLSVSNNAALRDSETLQTTVCYTRFSLDIQGNMQSITDPRGNTVMSWQYDMLKKIAYQHSMDCGDRWMLSDVSGNCIQLWDSRGQIFYYTYDALQRQSSLSVDTGSGPIVYEKIQYGEGISGDKADNLRGKVYTHFDTAGQMQNLAYDFSGNRLASTRTLLKDYKNPPNWSAAPVMDMEVFNEEIVYDALNRPIQLVTADKSIFAMTYNEGGLLSELVVQIRGVAAVTTFVSEIDYNAKRQRERILYGNNTVTQYSYDPYTFRLIGLLSTGNNGSAILQDLTYTFDPVGNITRQFDNAQKTVFYGGQRVDAQSDYVYDALYQLIQASGREQTGQVSYTNQDNFNDSWCMVNLQPNSPVQLRNYTQKYYYDNTGNIQKMQHIAGSPGSWTRTYQYNASNNQLIATIVGSQNYAYTYNAHGSMLTLPQLQGIDWGFREELQHAGLGGGGDAYYVYDCKGKRVRKVIVRSGNKTTERIYIGGVEIYRERTGNTITLERSTLHVMDDHSRIAMIDSRTRGNDGSPAQLIRYQYSDYLASSCLELDDNAKIISYEEYHPYGTTAFQATDASRQVPAKRYRYTGTERDDETGMNYNTARYYLPWLGRWLNADPIGIKDGLNIYAYSQNRPTTRTDQKGTDSDDAKKPDGDKPHESSPSKDPPDRSDLEATDDEFAWNQHKPKEEHRGILATIGHFLAGLFPRILDAARDIIEGVIRAAIVFVKPWFHRIPGPGALIEGIVGAVGYLLAGVLTAALTLLFLEPVSRPLNDRERAITLKVFGNSIDLKNVRIKEGWSLQQYLFRIPHVYNQQIVGMDNDVSMDIFIHEMTHVWQEQHGNPLIARINNSSYEWEGPVGEGTPWDKLGPEQQAQVVVKAFEFERHLKEYEQAKEEYAHKPPLPPEIAKIYGPRTPPEKPGEVIGDIWTGLHNIDDYLINVLVQVRAGKGGPN